MVGPGESVLGGAREFSEAVGVVFVEKCPFAEKVGKFASRGDGLFEAVQHGWNSNLEGGLLVAEEW